MYKMPKGTEYRAKSGNKAGLASAGCEVELGNSTISVNGKEYHQIISSNYPYLVGMFVERKLLTLVTQPEPEPQPEENPYTPAKSLQVVLPDGRIAKNKAVIEWEF